MFTIGEFSRFAQVTPDLLRHYDHIGLFTPAHIDKRTGYRYYHVEQLPALNRILSLKDLGLSLEQIQQMMADNVTSGEVKGMLKYQRMETEETIRKEIDRLNRIEARLRYLEQHEQAPPFSVIAKHRPQQAWLAIEKRAYPDMDTGSFFAHVYTACQDVVAAKGGHFVCAMDNLAFDTEDWQMGFTLVKPSQSPTVQIDKHVLQVGALREYDAVASIVFNGRMQDYYRAYNDLAVWIDQNGYEVQGRVYEFIYRMDATGADQNTIEIQMPISSKTHSANRSQKRA